MNKVTVLIAGAVVAVIGIVGYLLYSGEKDLSQALQGFQLPSLPNISIPNLIPSLASGGQDVYNVFSTPGKDVIEWINGVTNPPPDYHAGQQDLVTKTIPQISQAYQPAIDFTFRTSPSNLGVVPSGQRGFISRG